MVKKIHSKTETTIETDSFDIVVCKDSLLLSYMNVFHLKGETHAQSKLGEIFGVIQVHDHSEQSAYLPNLIAQVIKKEYYKNSKRPTEESFEAALHKANSALAELAQHELVSWHGKLDAAVGAISEEHLFFTQTNEGKIFLIRDKKVIEISKGLDEPTENPLKTFSAVSSGSIEDADKLIFSTPSLNDTLPLEDLKRHANTFSSDEFDNLLKSTLDTEGENVGTIVVNFSEKTILPEPENKRKKIKNENYFGNNEEKQKKETKKKEPENKVEEKILTLSEKTEAIINGGKEKVENSEKEENTTVENKNLSPFEKQPELFIKEGDQEEDSYSTKDSFKDRSEEIVKKIKNTLPFSDRKTAANSNAKQEEAALEKIIETKKEKKTGKDKKDTTQEGHQIIGEELSTEIPPIKETQKIKKPISPKVLFSGKRESKGEVSRKQNDQTGTKLKNFWEKDDKKSNTFNKKIKKLFPNKEVLAFGTKKLVQRAKELIKMTFNKSISSEDKKSSLKFVAIVVVLILFLIIVFYFFSVFSNRYGSSRDEQIFEEANQEKGEAPVLFKEDSTEIKKVVDLESDVVSMAYDDGSIFMLTSLNSFYRYETHNGTLEEISIGEHVKNARTIGAINNLNLILFVSDEKVVNYNRVTKSFDENKVELPDDLDVIGIGSYLSYFYVFDKRSGQIYRYSRDTDKPVVWLDNKIDASNATDIAIDDSIRIVFSDGTIEKYFKNKLESSFLLDFEPKIIPHKITTATDHGRYYVLDSQQGLIAVVSKESDHVERTFKNEIISGAKDLHLDTEENKIYFVSSDAQLMAIDL